MAMCFGSFSRLLANKLFDRTRSKQRAAQEWLKLLNLHIGKIHVCKKHETFWDLSPLWPDMFTE